MANGLYTIVDDDQYDYLNQFKWHISNGYAVREHWDNGKRQNQIWMHRVINSTPYGYFTDHINGNKLDNRKTNLRTVTKSQNAMNYKIRKDNLSSSFRGVQKHKLVNKYMARIRKDGKVYYIGLYNTAKSAAEAYNRKAIELFGEYAKLNMIEK